MSNSHRQLRFGSIELRPDGAILAGGLPLPGSVAFDNTIVDDVRLDKAAGQGEPITLTFADGNTLRFAWSGKAWTTDGDVPTQSLPESTMTPVEFTIGPPPWKNPVIWVAVVLLGGVAVVAALYLLGPLKQILSPADTPGSAHTQTPTPPPPKKADPALVAKVRSAHTEATNRVSELQSTYRKLDTDFREALGFGLEDSGSTDSYPRELVNLMTGDDPPIRPWTGLRNAAIATHVFEEKQTILRSVEVKLRDLDVSLTDKHDLEDVTTWAGERLSAIRGQAQNLSELKAALAARTTKSNGD